ncbi:MAG TPA: SH3 domain-containing protein [Stellaceae bacterium]|nr:SH3 domain-containing protein [Stellaceae bacterium]
MQVENETVIPNECTDDVFISLKYFFHRHLLSKGQRCGGASALAIPGGSMTFDVGLPISSSPTAASPPDQSNPAAAGFEDVFDGSNHCESTPAQSNASPADAAPAANDAVSQPPEAKASLSLAPASTAPSVDFTPVNSTPENPAPADPATVNFTPANSATADAPPASAPPASAPQPSVQQLSAPPAAAPPVQPAAPSAASAAPAKDAPPMYVAADSGLNVRSDPSAGSDKVGAFPRGAKLQPTGNTETDEDGKVWSEVTGTASSGEQVTGWVSQEHLCKTPPPKREAAPKQDPAPKQAAAPRSPAPPPAQAAPKAPVPVAQKPAAPAAAAQKPAAPNPPPHEGFFASLKRNVEDAASAIGIMGHDAADAGKKTLTELEHKAAATTASTVTAAKAAAETVEKKAAAVAHKVVDAAKATVAAVKEVASATPQELGQAGRAVVGQVAAGAREGVDAVVQAHPELGDALDAAKATAAKVENTLDTVGDVIEAASYEVGGAVNKAVDAAKEIVTSSPEALREAAGEMTYAAADKVGSGLEAAGRGLTAATNAVARAGAKVATATVHAANEAKTYITTNARDVKDSLVDLARDTGKGVEAFATDMAKSVRDTATTGNFGALVQHAVDDTKRLVSTVEQSDFGDAALQTRKDAEIVLDAGMMAARRYVLGKDDAVLTAGVEIARDAWDMQQGHFRTTADVIAKSARGEFGQAVAATASQVVQKAGDAAKGAAEGVKLAASTVSAYGKELLERTKTAVGEIRNSDLSDVAVAAAGASLTTAGQIAAGAEAATRQVKQAVQNLPTMGEVVDALKITARGAVDTSLANVKGLAGAVGEEARDVAQNAAADERDLFQHNMTGQAALDMYHNFGNEISDKLSDGIIAVEEYGPRKSIEKLSHDGDTATFAIGVGAKATNSNYGVEGNYGYGCSVKQVGEGAGAKFDVNFDKNLMGIVLTTAKLHGVKAEGELGLKTADNVTMRFDSKEDAAKAVDILKNEALAQTARDGVPDPLKNLAENPLTQDHVNSILGKDVAADFVAPTAEQERFLHDHISGYSQQISGRELGKLIPEFGKLGFEGRLSLSESVTRKVELPRDGKPGTVTITFADTLESNVRIKNSEAPEKDVGKEIAKDAGEDAAAGLGVKAAANLASRIGRAAKTVGKGVADASKAAGKNAAKRLKEEVPKESAKGARAGGAEARAAADGDEQEDRTLASAIKSGAEEGIAEGTAVGVVQGTVAAAAEALAKDRYKKMVVQKQVDIGGAQISASLSWNFTGEVPAAGGDKGLAPDQVSFKLQGSAQLPTKLLLRTNQTVENVKVELTAKHPGEQLGRVWDLLSTGDVAEAERLMGPDVVAKGEVYEMYSDSAKGKSEMVFGVPDGLELKLGLMGEQSVLLDGKHRTLFQHGGAQPTSDKTVLPQPGTNLNS